jgi:glycosyltransferase involved in cell wall biosynthesis
VPSLPTVSVILPTYNRKDLLRETLETLARQTYPGDRFEVIVVDDGSTDGTEAIAAETFPFTLRYFRQSNQGDAAARNLGARQSQADILVFLDDDILLEPGYLANLIQAHDQCQNRIVVGTWNLWQAERTRLSQTLNTMLAPGADPARSLFEQDAGPTSDHTQTITELPFRDVESNNMSLKREAYFTIGMMQGLDFSGSSMWCDLEFTYRAYRQGFEFRRSTNAICWHRDHAALNLDAYKQRARTAAYRAVVLFQSYPELLTHVPMFSDKTPIIWGQDPPRLMARKFARSTVSSRPALWSMERIVKVLEKRYPASSLLPILYRFIIGGYIFHGYREGLREFGPVDNLAESILLA